MNAKDLQKLLQRLATTSGGRAFFANTPAKLDEVFAEILEVSITVRARVSVPTISAMASGTG